MTKYIPSQMDIDHLQSIRANVVNFMKYSSENFAIKAGRLLDIAPQDHEGARPFFSDNIIVETFDINPQANATYTGDITQYNDFLPNDYFNYVVCTEVLEHTLQPFDAVKEIYRILSPDGYLFLSVPFNFRIHGPLPDCWRFTEHGLRALLQHFTIVSLNEVETPNRPLMPVHYTVVAQK